jgi:beta-glucosidase
MSFWTLGIGTPNYDSTRVITPAMALKPALEALGFQVTIAQSNLSFASDEVAYSASIQAAKEADLIIACVGESGLDCGESRSVSDINLPRGQERFLRIATSNGAKPTIMVLFNSRPLTFTWASENLESILVAWQPGYETGNALVDVLTGAVNPGGKLPVTFPRSIGQVPLYYNALNTGRPQERQGQMWTSGYLDSPTTPAYPFGFGMSYTTFAYEAPKVNKSQIKAGETVEISVTVTNTGKVAGSETVQCYIRDLVADIARPVKELKGFEKIFLAPGEKRTVVFKLTENDLAYWNTEAKRKADPGKFKVFTGGNSRDVQETEFELQK